MQFFKPSWLHWRRKRRKALHTSTVTLHSSTTTATRKKMIGMQLLDLESLLRNEDAILRPKHLSTIPAHLISPKIQNTKHIYFCCGPQYPFQKELIKQQVGPRALPWKHKNRNTRTTTTVPHHTPHQHDATTPSVQSSPVLIKHNTSTASWLLAHSTWHPNPEGFSSYYCEACLARNGLHKILLKGAWPSSHGNLIQHTMQLVLASEKLMETAIWC